MKRLLVVGAGGHAKVVIDAVQASGQWNLIALVDDDVALLGRSVEGVPVVGTARDWRCWVDRTDAAVVALGNNQLRQQIQCAVKEAGIPVATVVHPRATLASSAILGAGCVVMAGGIVNPGTRIGAGGIVNTSASVDHDCVIGDWVHIAPGVTLCGEVQVGPGALLGVGAKVLPGIRIGERCIVGAGAVVIRDLSDGEKVAGVPARPL